MKKVFNIIRPHHWLKNFLVFAPLFFAGDFLDLNKLWLTVLLFFAFSAIASSIYIINDITDKEKDAHHPKKKNRPIAAGQISIEKALIVFVILMMIATYLATYFNLKTNIILFFYLILNFSYSFKLKHIAVVDIFVLAFMYFLRIKAGGEILDIPLSNWLILVTFFLALFLVIGKRKSEYIALKNSSNHTRVVLFQYNEIFLDHLLTIVVTAVLISYALYTVEMNVPYLIYSTFFVIFGVVRYFYLIYKFNEGEDPFKLLFRDAWITLIVLAWSFYLFFIFYLI